MDASYAGSAAKALIMRTDLLPRKIIESLLEVSSPEDMLGLLDGTQYIEEVRVLKPFFSGYELLEVSATRRMVNLIGEISKAPPANGKDAIAAYTSKWDMDSIKSIITSKFLNKPLNEENLFIVDSNRFPVGIRGSVLSREDYKLMMNETSMDGVIKYLLKLGYGTYMMKYIEEYRKGNDISILIYSLDIAYYENLIRSLKFFRGDEEPLRFYIREQIDIRNLMTIIKARELSLDFSSIVDGIITLGNITLEKLRQMYNDSDLQIMKKNVMDYMHAEYGEDISSLTAGDVEIRLKRASLKENLNRLSMQAGSLGSIFYTIIMVENERNNLRTIFAGKAYGMDREKIRELLFFNE